MEKKPFWNGPRKPATGGPAPRPQGGRNKFRGNQKKDKDEHAINDQIRAQEVRLVGDNVEEGIYPIAKAIQIADELELDLIEIAPMAKPPVCRVMD